MSQWQDLVTASLIGTDRAVVPAAGIPGLPAGAGVGGGDPAGVLLDQAALLTAARRAGRRPGHAEPVPAAEPDRRPAVSPAAGRRLARLLVGEHQDLLAEWLGAAAARGLRPPAQLLPALLDRARRPSPAGPGAFALRRLAAEAGGSRARWLAGLNPDWAFLSAPILDGDEAWRLGTASVRRDYLALLRARDPGSAAQLIARGWAAAGPDERLMFINVMAEGLSLADEPLLQIALDDSVAWVRKAAADALASLPGSALARRMAGRAVRCVRMEHGKQGPRLVITPPTGADDAMRRDGITPGPSAGTSQPADRSGLLVEIVARTPLPTWTREFGMTAAQITGLPAGAWRPPLFTGWSRAARAQRDLEWTTALISRALAGQPAVTAAEMAALPQLIRLADPRLGAPGALPGLDPKGQGVPAAVRNAIGVLRFRYEMLKELGYEHGDG